MTTPRKSIRQFCLTCADTPGEVRTCQGDRMISGPCPLYPYRMPQLKGRPSVRTIKKHCRYCQNIGFSAPAQVIEDCADKSCPLYLFRMGSNPNYPKKVGLSGGCFSQNPCKDS